MSEWREGPITIEWLEPGHYLTTQGWLTDAWGVHERVLSEDAIEGDIWDITHLASGRRLCSANTREDAMRIVEEVMPLGLPASADGVMLGTKRNKRKLHRQLSSILARHGGWH